MIIPVSHDETTVRRRPLVTFAIMAACTAALIFTDFYGDSQTYARWGLIPKYPSPAGLLTHMFVHAGWGHLIGNLLILFLAGPPLEDRWGRPFFAGFYVIAGIVAGGFYTLMTPGSEAPLVGASGAISALMGASLVRFWSARIRFSYFFWAFRVIKGSFWMPVWAILPIWFVNSVTMARLADGLGVVSGVAYWCHVGGFAFGVAFAYGMRYWQVEGRYINSAIEQRITVAHNPSVDEAMELRLRGDPEAAYELLRDAARRQSEDPDVVTAFWELACEFRRPDEAVSLMFGVVGGHLARGEDAIAVQQWEDIAERAPAALPDRRLLLRVAPALVAHGKHKLAVRAMRRTLDPSGGELSAGEARRLLDLAQEVDPPTAVAAAQRVLSSEGLPDEKRAKLEALVAELEPQCTSLPTLDPVALAAEAAGREVDLSIPLDDEGEYDFTLPSQEEAPRQPSGPRELDASGSLVASESSGELLPDSLSPDQLHSDPPPVAAEMPEEDLALGASASLARFVGLKVIEAVPEELADAGVVLRRASGGSGEVAYAKIQALAVAAVGQLAPKPVLLVDLIMNWNDAGDGPLQVIRLRSDAFDARKLIPHAASALEAFRTLVEQLLARTGAVPLPDRDATRGRPFRTCPDLASYERDVLQAEA